MLLHSPSCQANMGFHPLPYARFRTPHCSHRCRYRCPAAGHAAAHSQQPPSYLQGRGEGGAPSARSVATRLQQLQQQSSGHSNDSGRPCMAPLGKRLRSACSRPSSVRKGFCHPSSSVRYLHSAGGAGGSTSGSSEFRAGCRCRHWLMGPVHDVASSRWSTVS